MDVSFAVFDRAYMTVQDLLNAAFPYLEYMVWVWFGLFCAWAIFLGAIETLQGQNPMGMISGMFMRLGIFVYLASVWKLIIDGLGNMALEIGLKISGSPESAEKIMSPSGIFGIGNAEANRVLEAKNAMCEVWTSCIVTIGDQFLLELLVLGIWACFAILMLALVMAALTFKKHGVFAFMFLPMSQLKATAFLTESAISGVLQGMLWLAFIAMVAGFGSTIFGYMAIPEDPSMSDILPAFLVYLFIGVMAWLSRSFAQGIITGTTRVGGEAMTAAARNSLSWMTGAGALGQSLAAISDRTARQVHSGVAAAPGEARRIGQNVSHMGQNVAHMGRVAHARMTGATPPQRPAQPAARQSSSSARRGGKWDMPPTQKQQAAARQRGVDISGMTRGRASEALEKQGKMDPSWYKE